MNSHSYPKKGKKKKKFYSLLHMELRLVTEESKVSNQKSLEFSGGGSAATTGHQIASSPS